MVTSLYAGILGLIYVGLSIYVIMGRFKYQVSLGDGGSGSEGLLKRTRVHANFMEYVPIALVLMILAEVEGISEIMLHLLGAGLVISRILHPLGVLGITSVLVGRRGGMALTFLVVVVAAILCIKSYFIF